MQLISTLQQDFLAVLAQNVNILVLLADKSEDNMFFAYTTFEGTNRSNIGSTEYNSMRGVDISDFVRKSIGLTYQSTTALHGAYINYIESKMPVNVKFANNLQYLIFAT